ncbi:adenylyltransferase/cytidyltransferase family protein [Actinomadura macrotermitis]|uniref:ethanolamine-phosphate cytidylyltransferase n=1 Tax=Actinomadura macrotermitis TaxID=2585200 RepID=A0A7K0BSI3_9ACTN|nr:adenylyltransferase/cytidyltransferase family protein [Actinomadura macrotermitis]MQY03996.1 Bifunctional protein HldE [Actinomadura macrotermitis]
MDGVVGFAPGVFDLFHVGHLDVLRRAAADCGRLVAGVCSDELAEALRGAPPVVPLIERMEIVGNCRYVADVVPLTAADLRAVHADLGFRVLYTGAEDEPLAFDLAGTGVRVQELTGVPRTRSAALRAALSTPGRRSSVA